MRRNRTVRLEWGARMARGRENARLERAADMARDVGVATVAGALVWDRKGRLTIIEVRHALHARTVEARVAPHGEREQVIRGLRAPGLGRVVLAAMGFGGVPSCE